MPFESLSQIRACYANKAKNPDTSWDCDAFKAHTPNMKTLPERKGDEVDRGDEGEETPKTVTQIAKEAFIQGFVDQCFANGITDPDRIISEARKAKDRVEKRAFWDQLWNNVQSAGKGVGGFGLDALKTMGILGSVALPIAGGFGVGSGIAGLQNSADNTDTDILRRYALSRAYAHKADDLAAKRDAAMLEINNPKDYKVIG